MSVQTITLVRRIAKKYDLKVKTEKYSFGLNGWIEDAETRQSSGNVFFDYQSGIIHRMLDFRKEAYYLFEDLAKEKGTLCAKGILSTDIKRLT